MKKWISIIIILIISSASSFAANEPLIITPSIISPASIIKVLITLIGIIVSIYFASYALGRFKNMGFHKNNNLQVVTGISLGQRDRLVVVQAGKTQILLGISPGRINTLHVFSESDKLTEDLSQPDDKTRVDSEKI